MIDDKGSRLPALEFLGAEEKKRGVWWNLMGVSELPNQCRPGSQKHPSYCTSTRTKPFVRCSFYTKSSYFHYPLSDDNTMLMRICKNLVVHQQTSI